MYVMNELFYLVNLVTAWPKVSSSSFISVVEPHTPAYSRIVYHFGHEVLLENGQIDRQKLGQIIFAHEEKRRLLNSITHPEIHKAMLKEIIFYFLRGEDGLCLILEFTNKNK